MTTNATDPRTVLAEALALDAVGPSDELPSNEQRAQIIQRKLDLARGRLVADPKSQDAAIDVVECIVRTLRDGQPDRQTLLLLALFVERHMGEFGRSILGVTSFDGGRPRADDRKTLARDAFIFAREVEGLTVDAALVVAYDHYFKTKGRTHAGDLRKPLSGGSDYPNHAQRTMTGTIFPMLKGLVETRSRGRPRKHPSKASEKLKPQRN